MGSSPKPNESPARSALHSARLVRIDVLALLALLAPAAVAEGPEAPDRPSLALPEDEVRRLAEAEARVQALRRSGELSAAQQAAGELLELSRALAGSDHWRTRDAQRELAALERLAALSPADRERVERFESDLADVRRLEAEGDAERAEELARDALRRARQLLGAADPVAIAALEQLAGLLFRRGEIGEAEETLRELLEARLRALGDDHPATAATRADIAVHLDFQMRHAEAEAFHAEALETRGRLLGPTAEPVLSSARAFARNQRARGKIAREETLHRRALAALEASRGAMHTAVATALLDLAECLGVQDRHREALALVDRAQDVRWRSLGPEHELTLEARSRLASALEAAGETSRALEIHEEVMETASSALGESHPLVAHASEAFASDLEKLDRAIEAEPLRRRAVAIRRRIHFGDDRLLGIAFLALARNLELQGRLLEAETLLKTALEKSSASVESPAELATFHDRLAENLRLQGRHGHAVTVLERALEDCRRHHGEDHAVTAALESSLASVLESRGDRSAAEPLRRRLLDRARRVLGEDSPDTLDALLAAAAVVAPGTGSEQAGPLLEKALAVAEGRYGKDHPRTAAVLARLGVQAREQGDFDRAVELLRRAAETGGPAGASAAIDLGLALFLQGRNGEAAGAWEKALPLFDSDTGERRSPWLLLAELRAREGNAAAAWDLLERHVAEGELDPTSRRWLRNARRARAVPRASLAAAREDLPPEAALVAWFEPALPGGSPWALVERQGGGPASVPLPGSGAGGSWTPEDQEVLPRLAALLEAPPAPAARKRPREVASLRAKVRRLYLEPVAARLARDPPPPGIRELAVLPSGGPLDSVLGLLVEDLEGFTVRIVLAGRRRAAGRVRGADQGTAATRLLAVPEPAVEGTEAAETASPPRLPDHGTLITGVRDGSNAALAGIRTDDVLLAYDGRKLLRAGDLSRAIRSVAKSTLPRKAVPVEVWRHGRTLRLEAAPGTLGVRTLRRPAAEALRARAGVRRLLVEIEPERGAGGRRGMDPARRAFGPASGGVQTETLPGEEASERKLLGLSSAGALGTFDAIHIAAPARLDRDVPLRSAILLAPDARIHSADAVLAGERLEDGSVTPLEIEREWATRVSAVILGGARTTGARAGEASPFRLARALHDAGARHVVTTLWEVDPEPRALLLSRFLEHLLRDGKPPEAALRAARKSVRAAGFEDPHFWAGFVVTGRGS